MADLLENAPGNHMVSGGVGAVNAIRTRDLFLTKEVLCRLSYNSKMATWMGLEPTTSSVTG